MASGQWLQYCMASGQWLLKIRLYKDLILDVGFWMLDTGCSMLDADAAGFFVERKDFSAFYKLSRFSEKSLSIHIQYQVSSIH
jgi:hypothetical protein